MKNRIIILQLFVLVLTLTGCSGQNNGDKDIVIPEGYVAEKDNDMCFDEPDNEQLYNYSPTVMVDGHEAHIYYCTSKISGKAGADDRIGYRHGIKKMASGIGVQKVSSLIEEKAMNGIR